MTVRLSASTFEVLRDAVEDTGTGASLRANYSGRMMYGDLCLGLVCHQPTQLVQFVFTLQRVHDEHDGVNSTAHQQLVHELSALILELEPGFTPTRQDSMGHDLVYYWPGVAVER